MASPAAATAASLSSTDLRAAAWKAAVQHQCSLARLHPALFSSVVIKDERSGNGITLAPIHTAWHALANDHDRLLLWSHVESGKTTQMAIARALYELGRDPTTRIAIVSNTHTQAEKIVHSISRYIESSPELHQVFPKLVRSEPWTSSQLFVKRTTYSKDPSVQAFGVHGNVLGARIDFLILDDILDYENCRTPASRKDLWDWYHSTLAGRLTAGARVVCIGTAFHPDDLLHRLAALPGWSAYRYPVLDEAGQPRWPDRWPPERIAKKRDELGPLEFARQMLCVSRDDAEARFKREWIEVALKRGEGKSLCYGLSAVPSGCRVYTGVDLAVQRHSASDWTVLFTLVVTPDGSREVLGIERGRWSGPEIISRIFDVHRRYQSICIVENNAAQDFIVQFAQAQGASFIRPYTTGRQKASPEFGIESLATEMAAGKWIIPNQGGRVEPVLDPWISEMLYYDPAGHTGDCLMASWFATQGARLGEIRAETGRLDLTAR